MKKKPTQSQQLAALNKYLLENRDIKTGKLFLELVPKPKKNKVNNPTTTVGQLNCHSVL